MEEPEGGSVVTEDSQTKDKLETQEGDKSDDTSNEKVSDVEDQNIESDKVSQDADPPSALDEKQSIPVIHIEGEDNADQNVSIFQLYPKFFYTGIVEYR